MKQMYCCVLVLLFFLGCKTAPPYSDPIPEHDTFEIASEYVNEKRVVNVWMPPNYSPNEPLPVLYMPDGGVKEDFPPIANTLSKLIVEKSIPPIILVGIENTERGRDLTGYSEAEIDAQYCPVTDGAKNFRAFITQELVPEINTRYSISGKKGIIGESLAGLFVMETFLQHPQAFDFYIAFDPSLWWNDHYLVKNSVKFFHEFPEKETILWFAGSSAADISKYTIDLHKVLENDAPNTLNWKYSNEPKEKHNTIFRATKEKALIWTLNQ